MVIDALILAGGRSSRLVPTGEWNEPAKQKLRVGGTTLLELAVGAARAIDVRAIVVVGDEAPEGAVAVREEPAFAGPVAAVAAGRATLAAGEPDADAVLVLACDMPGVGRALPALVAAFADDGCAADGVVAVDRGRRQQLVLLVAPAAVDRALGSLPTVVDASMRALLAGLDLTDVAVPDCATDDIDTWDDAARFGATAPEHGRSAT